MGGLAGDEICMAGLMVNLWRPPTKDHANVNTLQCIHPEMWFHEVSMSLFRVQAFYFAI